MNTKLLIAIAIGLLTSACAATTQRTLVMNCDTPTIPTNCTTPVPNNKIIVNVSASHLVVSPKNYCSKPNATIEVKVVPPNSGITVVAVPKDAANGWILSSNVTDPSKITITVPNGANGDYEYLFITSDGQCYDPRIHIDPS
jgi:hypothetical protein